MVGTPGSGETHNDNTGSLGTTTKRPKTKFYTTSDGLVDPDQENAGVHSDSEQDTQSEQGVGGGTKAPKDRRPAPGKENISRDGSGNRKKGPNTNSQNQGEGGGIKKLKDKKPGSSKVKSAPIPTRGPVGLRGTEKPRIQPDQENAFADSNNQQDRIGRPEDNNNQVVPGKVEGNRIDQGKTPQDRNNEQGDAIEENSNTNLNQPNPDDRSDMNSTRKPLNKTLMDTATRSSLPAEEPARATNIVNLCLTAGIIAGLLIYLRPCLGFHVVTPRQAPLEFPDGQNEVPRNVADSFCKCWRVREPSASFTNVKHLSFIQENRSFMSIIETGATVQ